MKTDGLQASLSWAHNIAPHVNHLHELTQLLLLTYTQNSRPPCQLAKGHQQTVHTQGNEDLLLLHCHLFWNLPPQIWNDSGEG